MCPRKLEPSKSSFSAFPRRVHLKFRSTGPDLNLRMPESFPHEEFIEFWKQAGMVHLPYLVDVTGKKVSLEPKLIRDDPRLAGPIESAWNAVRYRYRACAECNEEFKGILGENSTTSRESAIDGVRGESSYRLERCLYNFFVNSISVFDSFGFCLYYVGRERQRDAFRHASQPRKISLRETNSVQRCVPQSKDQSLSFSIAAFPGVQGARSDQKHIDSSAVWGA
jgi:hypothetical protein